MIPTDIALKLIPEYKESDAVCIALGNSKNYRKHFMISSQFNPSLFNYNPKKTLAYCIGFHTEAIIIPSPVLVEAIRLHCERFPYIYKTYSSMPMSSKSNIITYGVKELMHQIPFFDPSFIGQGKDIVKYGNCIKDLSVQIRVLLEQDGTIELGSWENGNFSGTYILHRDIDPLTDQPRILRVFIKLQRSETRKEETDDCITTITTYNHKIVFSYE